MNRAAFRDASMSMVPARCTGWFATTPIGPPVERRERGDEVRRVPGAQLEEGAGVGDVVDHHAHVVGGVRSVRNRVGRDRAETRPIVIAHPTRGIGEVVIREIGEQLDQRVARDHFVAHDERRDTGAAIVHRAAAELARETRSRR